MPYNSTELKPEQRVLLEAAKIVRKRWRQGGLGFEGGPRCAMGAIGEVAVYSDVVWPALDLLEHHIGKSIPSWNDAPGRTAEEVARAMEEAAMGDGNG